MLLLTSQQHLPVINVLFWTLPSISKDMDSAIREHLHNLPMAVKPVPQATQLANDLC